MTRAEYDSALANLLAKLLVAEYLKRNEKRPHGGEPVEPGVTDTNIRSTWPGISGQASKYSEDGPR